MGNRHADEGHGRILSRRALLRAALATAATAASGAVLAACGGGSSPTATSAPAATAAKPTTAPSAAAPTTGAAAPVATGAATAPAASAATGAGPTTAASTTTTTTAASADGKLPSTGSGVPDAYTKFPTAFKTVTSVPGKGTKVTALLVAYNPPPPPREQNKWWQELEKRLGITYEPIIQPADGYPEKLAAITASGNLPDLTFLYFEQVPDQYKLIQQGAYTDLTAYLSGDALKDYPNLALFPPISLEERRDERQTLRCAALAPRHRRADALAQGLGGKVRHSEPEKCGRVLRPDGQVHEERPGRQWQARTPGACTRSSSSPSGSRFFRNMFRVPNEWRKNADGSLTAYLETDEFKQTMAYMKKLYDRGHLPS